MDDLDSPYVFPTKPARPPRSSKTLGLARSKLYFLPVILGRVAWLTRKFLLGFGPVRPPSQMNF